MVYGAGNRTLRFRLNTEMTPLDLDALFERLESSLTTLRAGADPSWQRISLPDQATSWPPPPSKLHTDYRIVQVSAQDFGLVRDSLVAIENATYEPARQDDMDEFGQLLHETGSLCLVATRGDCSLGEAEIAGMAFAFPLRCFRHIEGPDTDLCSALTVFCTRPISVFIEHRGKGLGAALKHAQVVAAMRMTNSDGTSRYDFMTGRNRIGATDAMQVINSRYGAWSARRLSNQYRGEGLLSTTSHCALHDSQDSAE